MSTMRQFRNSWQGALPALLLPLLVMLSPNVYASGGDPRLEGLRELVEEVGAMAENPGLGDNAEAVAKARDEAVAAIDAGRLHLALEKLVSPLEVGPGLIYRAAMTEKIQDQAAFEAEWRTQGTMVAEEQRRAAAAKCPEAPAHVRAVAERAANRSVHYYDAARAMAPHQLCRSRCSSQHTNRFGRLLGVGYLLAQMRKSLSK